MDIVGQIVLNLFAHRTKTTLVDPEKGYLIQMMVGALIVFTSLFFPFFTITYSPPGGSALVYGKPMSAFVDVISVWQFADTAAYFRLLPALLLLFGLSIIGFIRLWLDYKTAQRVIDTLGNVLAKVNVLANITGSVLDYIHAFVHIIIAFGWLLILLLGVIESPWVGLTMPPNGEADILSGFQTDPFSAAGAAQDAFVRAHGSTPNLSVTLNVGYYLLLVGIVIGGLAVFKKIIITIIVLIVLLPILSLVYHPLYMQLTQLLGF